MRESGTRLAAAFGLLSALAMAASPAHAQLPPIGIPLTSEKTGKMNIPKKTENKIAKKTFAI